MDVVWRDGEKDEKVAGTYVRYAGEKHPGGAPAVPPTFKVRVASRSEQAPRVPGGSAINSRLGILLLDVLLLRLFSFPCPFLSFLPFSPAAYSHAIHDSRRIERPRGHTPSSREPQVERGAHRPPSRPFLRFRRTDDNRGSTWPSVISAALLVLSFFFFVFA